MSEAAEFSTDHMDPDWGPWLKDFSLDVTYPVPPELYRIITTVFFSNGLQQLDVSKKIEIQVRARAEGAAAQPVLPKRLPHTR